MRPEVERDLAFGLGVTIVQRVAPLVRVRQAISRDYGLPLDRRSHRVLAKLEGKPDPSPSLAPAPLAAAPSIASFPRPPSIPPLGLPAPTDMKPLYEASRELASHGSIAPHAIRAVGQVTIREPEAGPPARDGRGTPAPAVPAVSSTPAAAPASIGAHHGSGRYAIPKTDLATWGAESKQAERRARSRHRGPYTTAAAEQDLLSAETRDAVLNTLFDFACQYFEYSALFAVHGDLAEGRSAHGPGADHAKITGIGVPLDMPGALATARRNARFGIVALAKDGLDARLATDLERHGGKKVLLLPMLVRGRCVLIFYGDDGAEDVDLSGIGDVIAFAPLVASALEGIILRKKTSIQKTDRDRGGQESQRRGGAPSRPRAALPSRDERREALAQALETTLRRISSKPPPPASNRGRATPPASREAARQVQAAAQRREGAEDPTRPITEPAIPSARAAASRELEAPDDEPRAPTPSQGTPALAAVTDLGSAASTPEPPIVAEISESASLPRAAASSVDDSPEISIGTEDIDLPNERAGPPSLPDSQVVVPAKRPVKPHSSAELRLPTVILNIDTDMDALVRRLVDGDETVMERLSALGATAASFLVSRFPGPVREADRLGAPELASQRGPVLRALARIGQAAVPFLAVRSNDRDAGVRIWATRLLGEIPSEDSALAVSRRVADSSTEVRRAALEAGKLLQSDEHARTALRDQVLQLAEGTSSIESRVAAIEALAHFRDGRTVPRLVRLLASKDEVGQSAEWALGVITRQALGRDPTAWEAWWKGHGDRHRIEWLIDSLMHDDPEIRRAAGEELKALTKEYFGYYDDLAKAERSKAQRRYREWWEATGKAKFSE